MPGEFDFIQRFLACFPKARVPVGPGDDCAVLAPSKGALCVTTDAVVEDVHFTRATFSPADIGHKALAVNLSDLAAMGAAPRWFVCALALPGDFPARELSALGRGMAALAKAHRIALVGGNFTSARELSVTLTATGELSHAPITRAGARPGDLLYVSGTLGDARLGLKQLQAGVRRGSAVRRQRRPEPRVALGLLAARFASAGLDVSDGLAQDLGHLCAASRVGVALELDQLPVSPALRAALGPREALLQALQGGEDYELLLAIPPARARAFERACGRSGERVTRVGELTRERQWKIRDGAGRPLTPPEGFDHFARSGRHIRADD
ncbi:thiamine-phosphate kinase [Corallococcus sicarius]|uniref:Thiamine-monophosphate kinase n=1 Tax=Corallococcus sicarius TaxID=2316726 RepID=A0A3A8MWT4_9BACT|nr:thiamine-phosphate kinase [Corallococcus sicarius]RKH36727.1 thiamine-phosphate kinase [Corallococcus sicarius]